MGVVGEVMLREIGRACRVVFFSLMAASCTTSWRTRDTVLTGAAGALLAVDYLQTRHIVSVCAESNPIIGACGQGLPPELYFPMLFAIHLAWLVAWPPEYRDVLNGLMIGSEAATTYYNWQGY